MKGLVPFLKRELQNMIHEKHNYIEWDWKIILYVTFFLFAIGYMVWHLGRYYEVRNPQRIVNSIPCQDMIIE